MKLTLRPEWRPRPLTSFLGFVDIKTGVTVAILFAVSRQIVVDVDQSFLTLTTLYSS